MDTELAPIKNKYCNWYDRNKEKVKEYKRNYYATHPEYAERKRAQASERYARTRISAVSS